MRAWCRSDLCSVECDERLAYNRMDVSLGAPVRFEEGRRSRRLVVCSAVDQGSDGKHLVFKQRRVTRVRIGKREGRWRVIR